MDQTTRTISNPYVPHSGPITIKADERDPENGNGSHTYVIHIDNGEKHSLKKCPPVEINFQHGPIQDTGANGITNEALIAVVIDRLEGFNESPFRCRENSLAITALEEAMHWLHFRTVKRQSRGVEGTNKP
jgi:hypothetical protein